MTPRRRSPAFSGTSGRRFDAINGRLTSTFDVDVVEAVAAAAAAATALGLLAGRPAGRPERHTKATPNEKRIVTEGQKTSEPTSVASRLIRALAKIPTDQATDR